MRARAVLSRRRELLLACCAVACAALTPPPPLTLPLTAAHTAAAAARRRRSRRRYRFEGAAGKRMAEAPPFKNLNVCGTNKPGWLRLANSSASTVLSIPHGTPPVGATACFASGPLRTYSPGYGCSQYGCSGTYTPKGWSTPCGNPTPVKVCACSYDGGLSTTYSYKLPKPPVCTAVRQLPPHNALCSC